MIDASREALERALIERDDYRYAWEDDNAALADALRREEALFAERDTLAAKLADVTAENDRLAGVLKSLPGMIKATTLDDGPERLSKDTLGAWVDGLTACEKVAQRAVDAALKGDKP